MESKEPIPVLEINQGMKLLRSFVFEELYVWGYGYGIGVGYSSYFVGGGLAFCASWACYFLGIFFKGFSVYYYFTFAVSFFRNLSNAL